MKNLKKILLSLMVLFLAFAFIGCPAEPDPVKPPETPVVTNNFEGKTFIGMTGEGEDAEFASYIIFTSDKDCEVMFFDEEPMPATYTVADDVATLTGTGEYAALQISTTKLTDGTFEITIPPAVSQQEKDIVVSYAVGTLWTILYDIPDSDEDFSLIMPEKELDVAVENYGFVDGDFTKNEATKTVTLTASGWEKVQAAMGGGSGGEDSGEVTDETWTVLGPDGSFIRTFANLTEAQAFAGENGLEPDVDFNMDPDAQTITLTAAGAEKLGMGGDTEGGDSGEVYFYMYNGEPIGGKNTLEDFQYDDVKMYDLVEGTDYNIDHKNKYINFTDSGVEKLGMGGGSDDETWTVLDPEGNTLETFESLEAAGAFASSSGLVEVVDYDIDFDNQTITLTAEGLAKVSAGA